MNIVIDMCNVIVDILEDVRENDRLYSNVS